MSASAVGGRLGAIAGAVLAGGASARMGRDRARTEVAGVAVATRVAGLLATLCEDVVIAGGDPPPEAPGRRVPDPEGPPCALRGLVAALIHARAERVLVVATDLPLVTPDLLLALVAWPEADAVVPRDADGAQPLCGLYRGDAVLPVARARLAADELSLHRLLDDVNTSYLDSGALARVDPEGVALTNVNTPTDLARANALLAGLRGGDGPP